MTELVRLRFLADVNPHTPGFDQLAETDDVSFLPLEAVWSDGRLDISRSRPKAEVAAGYVRFARGDVLCPKVTPTFQAGRSALLDSLPTEFGAASTEVHVLRAKPERSHPGYIRYGLLTKRFLEEGVSRFQGVAGLQRVPDSFVRDFEVINHPLDQQRRIAAFLDDQVARIDGAISLSHSQRELLTTRDLALLDGLLGRHNLRLPETLDGDWKGGLPNGWRVIHLSQVLKQLTNGYVGPTRDILYDDGIRYIQSVHIKNGSIDFERRPFYVSNQWHRERPRINLRAEDVLIVQTGAIGQVAVVPSDFGPASCHALLIARVQPSIVSGRYLAAYLRSPLGFQSLLSRATGALHPHLEGGIKNVNVIVPPLDVQDSILLQLDELRRANGVVIRGLERRTVLLQERKRSLITAAVTGEFDVSSASTRALAGVAS